MALSSVFFERTGKNSLSANVFYGLIGLFLVYGLGGTAWVSHRMSIAHYNPGNFEFLILGLIIPLAGALLALKSDNSFLSFIGYNMILIPFGVVLAPVLNQYQPDVIEKAFSVTCGATLFMVIVSVSFPKFFSSLGTSLFFALLGLLAVRLAQAFIPSLNEMTWVDWLAAGIFSLYIGYD